MGQAGRRQGYRVAGAAFGLSLAGAGAADYIAAVAVSYSVSTTDFGGEAISVNVQDLYLTSNDATDTLLNVYDLQLGAGAVGTTFFHSAAGTGWKPINFGGPFDGAAIRRADSFVTIGGVSVNGDQSPGAGSTVGLDPNFGGNLVASPNEGGGWYNGSPPNLAGLTTAYSNGITGVLIGRFTSVSEFSMLGTRFDVTWNNGLGTPGSQRSYTVSQMTSPAPGAIGLLGIAGWTVAARRRRSSE